MKYQKKKRKKVQITTTNTKKLKTNKKTGKQY